MRMLKRIVLLSAVLVLFLNLPCLWGLQSYVVLSSSLQPEIPPGSMIYVDVRENQQGKGETVYLQGKSKETGEAEGQILGVLKFIIPYVGYVRRILNLPLLLAFFLCICLWQKYPLPSPNKYLKKQEKYGESEKIRKVSQFWGLLFLEKKL